MNKSFFFFIFFCLSFYAVNAQDKQLRAYTLEDGLPQSQVYEIIQDKMGYLWLGTQGGGLCNFNGSTFEVFNEADGLQSNYVHAIHEKNDSLFVGTNQGLSIKVKSQFLNFETPQVNTFFQHKNKIYLGTKRGLYTVVNRKTVEKIKLHPEVDSSSINALVFDDEYFWIATKNGLWKCKNLKTPKLEKLEDNNFVALLQFKDKLFASTFNDGTFVYENKEEEPVLIREPLRINSLSIQNKDELWVTTDNSGISILDAKNYNEKAVLNRSNGLKVPHIRKVISDKHSNIWIATSGGGLYKYFQNNFKHYNRETGLKGNRVYALHHNNNKVWVSNSEAGLVKIDSTGINLIESPRLFKNVKIKTITSNSNDNIWSGSDGRGLWFRQTKTKDSIVQDFSDALNVKQDTLQQTYIENHVLNTDNGFPSNWIRKVQLDDNESIWVATYSSGIIKFNYYPENKKLVINKTFEKTQGIQDLLIRDMVKAPDGKFWYATQNGHLGYIYKDEVTHLGQVLKEKTAINALLFNNNTIFVGTAGEGIWWSNREAPNFKKLTGTKKLYSNNIYQLIFDAQGYLWSGTERGVDRIVLNKENSITDVFHFGRNDGFLAIETCLNAVDKDANNNLWFGGIYGLTQFKPSSTSKTEVKPELFFKDVKIANKSIDSLSLNTNSNTVLELQPNQNQVSFSYATVDLDHPNDVQYRYKLDNNNWSLWTESSSQDLPGLAYGDHTFTVQSRNYRWEESTPKHFKFYINSPLLKKAWFQWLVIALAIGLLSWLAWRYVKGVKQKTLEEQERLKMENHLLTLEQKALRLQMNPHFIFNVLNGIKAMATTKPDKMNNTINSFATLLRETLINSRKDTITLAQEIKTLTHYISVEQLMATKPFNYNIQDNTNIDAEEILVPPMLIQPFVENAIRHGILKGKKEGELSVVFNTTEDFLSCTIIDNGIGIFQSQKAKQKTDHQSMALTVTRERLESIAGKDALKISEIKNEDGTIGGTSITFKIPLETEY